MMRKMLAFSHFLDSLFRFSSIITLRVQPNQISGLRPQVRPPLQLVMRTAVAALAFFAGSLVFGIPADHQAVECAPGVIQAGAIILKQRAGQAAIPINAHFQVILAGSAVFSVICARGSTAFPRTNSGM